MKSVLCKVNQHIIGHKASEVWSVAGDMKTSSNILGFGGRFGCEGYNCLQCKVHSSDLWDTTPSELRSKEELWWYAHVAYPHAEQQYPFVCPACGKRFNNESDVNSDPAPADDSIYRKEHYSQGHKQPPLLDIDPCNYYVCSLHLLLAVTKLIFHLGIRMKVMTQNQANAVNQCLRQLDIDCKQIDPIGNNGKGSKVGKKVSFTGAECFRVLKGIDSFLDIVLGNDETEYRQVKSVFVAFVKTYDALRKKETQEKRQAQAEEVERLSHEFLEQFQQCFSEKHVNYYMHSLIHHVPEQIRKCPAPFFCLSGNGIEMVNQMMKRETR